MNTVFHYIQNLSVHNPLRPYDALIGRGVSTLWSDCKISMQESLFLKVEFLVNYGKKISSGEI